MVMNQSDISAVEDESGMRIEYHRHDFTMAFASLAPLVTEAFAYAKSGNQEEAMESLRRAVDVVRVATTTRVDVSVGSANNGPEITSVSELAQYVRENGLVQMIGDVARVRQLWSETFPETADSLDSKEEIKLLYLRACGEILDEELGD